MKFKYQQCVSLSVEVVSLLLYLSKLPILVSWNLFLTFFYALQLLWRVKKVIWDPRTWLTITFFYVALNIMILFFEVFLDMVFLILFDKTFTGFLPNLGNYISNYGLSSAVSVLIFTTLATKPVVSLMEPAKRLKVFREDVMKEIVAYNKEYIFSRLKRGLVIIILGLALKLLLK